MEMISKVFICRACEYRPSLRISFTRTVIAVYADTPEHYEREEKKKQKHIIVRQARFIL